MSWFREHLPHSTGECVSAVTFSCSLETWGVSRYCFKSQPCQAELCQVIRDTRPSPGEKLRGCQEDKHVWHCTNQAITESIAGTWVQPKGSGAREQAFHRSSSEQVAQKHKPPSITHHLCWRTSSQSGSSIGCEYLCRNSGNLVWQDEAQRLQIQAANTDQFRAELRHKRNQPLAQLIYGCYITSCFYWNWMLF